MREIKFRAWIERSMSFGVVDQISWDSDSDNDSYFEITTTDYPLWFTSDECVLEQCTGLKDKNGVEIYEGDIVKNTYGKLEKVVFVNGSFQCASINHPSLNLYLLDTYSNHIEIIGNIHENKEV